MISIAKIFLVVITATVTQVTAAQLAPLEPISSLDLQKYQGTWYEIAKYPNRFQAQCVKSTVVKYAVQASGTVEVINACDEKNGIKASVTGEARRIGTDKNPQSATLQVRFAPAWLSWLPFVWGNYWVVALDPQYQWSVVSEPGRELLWVLARGKQLDAATWTTIEAAIKRSGFDLAKLEKTVQD